jgi:hypothetical protein
MSHAEEIRSYTALTRQLRQAMAFVAEYSIVNRINAVESCRRNPFQPHVVWESLFGSMMQLDLHDAVSQELFIYGCIEPDLMDVLSWAVTPGMTVYDIGAHVGFFSIMCGRLVGARGAILAFESDANAFLHLETNLRNAALPQVTAHRAILSESMGTPEDGSSIMLDDLIADGAPLPDLVRLSMKGHELRALHGARALLRGHRPVFTLDRLSFSGRESSGVPASLQVLDTLRWNDYLVLHAKAGQVVQQHDAMNAAEARNLVALPVEKAAKFIDERAAILPEGLPAHTGLPPSTQLILCAGMPRSGSTWLYNSLRSLLSAARKNFYACWIEDFDPTKVCATDIALLKVHHPDPALALRADAVFSSYRDVRDVAASAVSMGWAIDTASTLQFARTAVNCHRFWARSAEIDVGYEDIVNEPVKTLLALADCLEFEIDEKRIVEIAAELNRAKAPLEGRYDPVTLLHANHRNDGRSQRWRDTLTDPVRIAIEQQFGDWLSAHGYVTRD